MMGPVERSEMAVAMLNVRMDKDLKAEGERVLAKHSRAVSVHGADRRSA